MQIIRNISICAAVIFLLNSCGPSSPGLFSRKTAHEQYGEQLKKAGLDKTSVGRIWFQKASESLNKPLLIRIPYKETGYFAAEVPDAEGFRFQANRGSQMLITVEKKPLTNFKLYVDLWERSQTDTSKQKLLLSLDTANNSLEYTVDNEADYILRVQPELLVSGEYTITIKVGPSLAFPVAGQNGRIASIWGDERDGGGRSHEGIDIFTPHRTPVLAAADGRITRVNNNNLGGKVIWLNPQNATYTLYYAHLDEQLANPGQAVKVGDTIGLVGNTGNARTTPPHLHFGIYAAGGAIDPLPFVNRNISEAEPVSASLTLIGKKMKSTNRARLASEPSTRPAAFTSLEANTLLRVNAATGSWYKVSLPDGQKGYVKREALKDTVAIKK